MIYSMQQDHDVLSLVQWVCTASRLGVGARNSGSSSMYAEHVSSWFVRS
jgi:hypothetical protein